MAKKILIVEDEKNLIKVIEDTLLKEAFLTYKATDGEAALDMFYEHNPDLILLDINLPKMNGWEVCQNIRKESNIPIIMMTARDSEIDELKGLSIGADDYITKPFSLKILNIKIKKMLKIDENSLYKFNDLSFDFKSGELKVDDNSIELTRREIQFLEYLIKNKGIAISRDQILENIWGYDFFGEDRTVDTHIKMLRNNLEKYRDHIITVRGIGYKYVEDKENE